jgi:signal transduction histidine kinase
MNDIRSVVRLLRDDPGTVPTAPRASELPQLVEAFASAGADITFRSTVDLENLPAPSALTVYRMVQEGLTNAVRHGTGGIDVSVDHAGGFVDVEISNDRAQPSAVATPGNGLLGMRERISAIAGTLEAGATGTGHRWVLHARIPA